MTKIKTLAYKDLVYVFGNPSTLKGRKKIKAGMKTYELPFSWFNESKKRVSIIKMLYCQEYIGPAFVEALQEIYDNYGTNIKNLGLNKNFGGCFNHRKTRDGKWWSVHAFGAAVDLWTDKGRMGKKPTIPEFCVDAFKKRGFCWGGDFRNPDGMHFSVCFG